MFEALAPLSSSSVPDVFIYITGGFEFCTTGRSGLVTLGIRFGAARYSDLQAPDSVQVLYAPSTHQALRKN